MSTVIEIERILSRGSKNTTYKLAVLRAIVDFIIEHPAREPRNGWHFVPVLDLARRVLTYYWRLALEGVPQGVNPDQVAVPREVRTLASAPLIWPGVDLNDPGAGWQLGEMMQRRPLPGLVKDCLLETRRVLLDQPLRYLPNLPGTKVRFFSVVTAADEAGHPRVDEPLELHLSAAPGKRAFASYSWPDLLASERTSVVLSARSFEEIASVRYWLLDSIKLRWALECRRFGDPAPLISVPSFELSPPARDPVLMDAFRAAYFAIGMRTDLYTGGPLSEGWHLDHVLPWSVFPVNLFWNLVPTSGRLNTEKSARVPALTDALRSRYVDFMTLCLRSGDPLVAEDERETYRRYFQSTVPSASPPEARARNLLSLLETTHGRLVQAGVDTWDALAS